MARVHCESLCESLVLRREGPDSLQEQIFGFFRDSILRGRIRKGRRIPASRRLAAELRVSRTTVVEAYERLEAQGYLVARPRAGLFVADVLPEEFSLTHLESGLSTSHEMVTASPTQRATPHIVRADSAALTPGIPALDQFPWSAWNKLSARLLQERQIQLLGLSEPAGERVLREAVAEYLGVMRGIECTADQVIIGSGSQALMETIVRAIARPGDQVWFEEPGDPASRAVLLALQLRPAAVPVDHEGIDVAAGCRIAPAARFALVAPSHHYPLGVTMSMARRRALLEWATKRRAWIVENEIDGDYRFVKCSREPLFSLDGGRRVIFLGSFNKALAPGLRIGYAVLPEALLESLRVVSPMVNVHHQLLLARMWTDGYLASHLRYLREVHARRRALLINALQEEMPELVSSAEFPEAGLRLPIRISGNVADSCIAEHCAARHIKVGRPLSLCYARAPRISGLNLGFASTEDADIQPAVRELAGLMRFLERGGNTKRVLGAASARSG